MTTVYCPSLDDADVIQVEFLTLQGKLLVDSGSTG